MLTSYEEGVGWLLKQCKGSEVEAIVVSVIQCNLKNQTKRHEVEKLLGSFSKIQQYQ